METTHIYLTTEQAIEESKKQDGLIPSEFLSTFPNNFGINLCAVKGFNIEMTEDKQYKSITVDFIPKTETIDERIKKEIIQFLQLPHPQFVGKRNHEEWIAWLEKPKYTEEDLEKEIDNQIRLLGGVHTLESGTNWYKGPYSELVFFAKHFFELGLKGE